MKNKLGWVLFLGGLVILAIVGLGVKATSTQSEAEKLRDLTFEMNKAREAEAAERDALRRLVLEAPEICRDVKTAIVFDVMEGEPDPGEDWPDWIMHADTSERECLLEAFHQTNAHALKIQGKEYVPEALSVNRTSRFISDLAGAALWTDGIDYGDTDASLYDLINGYYADRATSMVKPEQDY